MKFFSWLGTILIILLISAAITAPGDQKFSDFINKDKGGDTMNCKPIIGKSTEIKLFVRIASVKYVSYCEANKAPFQINNKRNGEAKTLNYIIPKITSTETYLGLFGRFWKI
ncbi:MAG TPA: hypothetical protein VKB95_13785 [Chitinophagaceae bacterium]|nr:hypothetical protein [Chitinophagaceae bacterium]